MSGEPTPPREEDVAFLKRAAAAGNPHNYDVYDPRRIKLGVPISYKTRKRIKRLQRRLNLKTSDAAVEYVLRLGLAAIAEFGTKHYPAPSAEE